ncbi:nucleoside-diphosphate sugar epimerase [Vibrio sp. VPAP30]|uniref:Nucleoside-diphosphate sugar epimerase n=1 Tax=Vibrio bivalvicida TaxID=1276888 RepID=A0A177XUS7_9VIBR|nr:nucleoside-diphosphate sugar epimerase [Vibrio sp. VPAP30]KLN65774.1 nucleoside-diphosphate sugar epimerase [Vibrio sp. VPAP30]OAJ92388.1 nucleoside-diphosphate sugar epimerase [Vibrio bivalvicida]
MLNHSPNVYLQIGLFILENSNNITVIIAGSTGLIGNELIKQMLERDPIKHIYALTRRTLPFFHPKLEQLQHPELRIQEWVEEKPRPQFGFICLGTTLKQAGSKQALEKVDYQLVCDIAQEMKLLGVKQIAVVSSYGASARAFSHYLRCKGRMELTIERMGFERVVFVRSGPLKGLREQPRQDEVVVQTMLKVCQPLMIGPLAKLIPIDAADVALAMQYSLFSHSNKKLEILDTVAMRNLIKKYQ